MVSEPETVDTTSLAPSVTGSIDGLIDSIADGDEAESPVASTETEDEAEPAKVGVDDGIELPVAEAPAVAAPTAVETGPVPADDSADDLADDLVDDPAAADSMTGEAEAQTDTDEIVGNIIWNIESAQKGRAEAPADPVVPVGPDPSLASEALEAAFAMLARREQGLPAEGFLMPKKAPGIMRIALLVPTSGAHNVLGSELQRGAELALFSLRNRQVELLVFDTAGDGADMAAREAVQAEADIIVGPLFSMPWCQRVRCGTGRRADAGAVEQYRNRRSWKLAPRLYA